MNADAYLRRVDAALSDLPWSVRRDLMAELKGHLEELPADEAARLGTPEKYAAEMRAAAGLERRRGPIAFLRARRPRNLILTFVPLAVAGLVIGSIVWIDSYQPLAFGGGSHYPDGAKGVPGVSGQSVVFRKGRPFIFGIQVTNTGRYTVQILDVPYAPIHPWTAPLLMTRPNYSGSMTRHYERFRPFALKPHQIVPRLQGRLRMPHRSRRRTDHDVLRFPGPVQVPLADGNDRHPTPRRPGVRLPEELPAAEEPDFYAVAGR